MEEITEKSHNPYTALLSEVRRYVSPLDTCVTEIRCAHTLEETREAWENFLLKFQTAINKLIGAAQKDSASKAWGHRLKNASTGDDPGLTFLRKARALVEHGSEPFADFSTAAFSIGNGAIQIGPSSSLYIQDCHFNGRHVPNAFVQAISERQFVSRGLEGLSVQAVAAQIKLKPVRALEGTHKGKLFAVPNSLAGKPLHGGSPLTLAAVAVAHIKELEQQLIALLRHS